MLVIGLRRAVARIMAQIGAGQPDVEQLPAGGARGHGRERRLRTKALAAFEHVADGRPVVDAVVVGLFERFDDSPDPVQFA